MKTAVLIAGVIAGGLAGRWLMLFAVAWDEKIEQCLFQNPDAGHHMGNAGFLPIAGSLIGAIIAASILALVKYIRKPKTAGL